MWPEGLGQLDKKPEEIVRNPTGDFPVCSTMPQLPMLPRADHCSALSEANTSRYEQIRADTSRYVGPVLATGSAALQSCHLLESTQPLTEMSTRSRSRAAVGA
jgi:hypothetical protein